MPAAACRGAASAAHAQQPAPQPPPSRSKIPIAPGSKTQLQAFDRGASDSARADQLRKFEEAAANQQGEIDRQEATARRAGCEKNSFLVLFSGQPAACGPLNNKIQQMKDNLDRIQVDMERLKGDAGARARGPAPRHRGRAGAKQLRRAVPAAGGGRPARAKRRLLPVDFWFTLVVGAGRRRHARHVVGAKRHLPHHLRAHLRRLLLSDFRRHQLGPLCRGRKGLPGVLSGQPRSSSTRIAIRARASTRRCRSRPSSPIRRCRMRSAIGPRSTRAAVAGGPAKAGRRP